MLRLEDLEQLSRFVDGELPAEAARALEQRLAVDAELRGALQSMRDLDALAPSLVDGDAFDARAAAQRAVVASRPSRSLARPLALAAAVLLVAGAALLATHGKTGGSAVAAAPFETVEVPGGEVTVWSGTSYRVAGDRVELDQGSLWISGPAVHVARGAEQLTVSGVAYVTTEPSQDLAHVTHALDHTPGSEDMHKRLEALQRLMRTGAARCAAGAMLTFCAADGAVAWATARPAHVQAPARVASAADARLIPVEIGEPVRTPEAQHPDEINAAIQGARAELAHCFEVPASSAESAVGQFQLTLALDAQGKVIQGTGGAEYSTRNPIISGCVLDALAGLSFPAGPWDHPLQLVFAAELQGQGAARALVLHLPELGAKAEVSAGSSPSQGPDGAPVTIVEYTDYECGFCARADSTMHQVMQAYPGQIRWVVKQRPLPPHPHARLAAKAALAAHAQGKFWPMHEALMKSSASLDRASIERLAKQQGLDLARFDAAVDGDTLEPALQADWLEADRAAVKGVPAFVINGHVLTGAQPLGEFKKAIDAALAGNQLPVERPTAEAAPGSLDGLQITALDGAHQPFARLGAKVTVLSFISSMLPEQSAPNPELQQLADSFAGDAQVRFLIVDLDPESASARDALRQQLARDGIRVPAVFEPGALLRYVNAHLQRPADMPANQMIVPGVVMLRDFSQVIVPHGTTTAALHAEIEAQR